MRDLLLLAVLAGALLTTIRYPFVGLLTWAWFTLGTPHAAAFTAGQFPLNLAIAAVTFVVFFFHGEFGKVRLTGLSWIILAFTGWLVISQLFSVWPENSAEPFDRLIKIMVFVFLCAASATSRLRFHALLWVLALVMGFHGAKGGLFTIATLGEGRVEGIPGTLLGDNNHLGISLTATLPIFLYLAGRARSQMVRYAILGVAALSVIAIIGTQSRGALLSLIALAGVSWLRSDKKLLTGILGAAVVFAAVPFLSDAWVARMETIKTADEDASFQGRIDAWVINWKLAQENPITGVGMRNSYRTEISETVSDRTPRAAHSIYFEILGGMGFVGLGLYLTMLGYGVLAARRAEKAFKSDPGGRWRSEYARHAQTSLIVFAVGGASVSLEMWEGYLMLIALVSVLPRVDLAASTERASFEARRVRARAERDARSKIRSKMPKDAREAGPKGRFGGAAV